MVIIDVGDAIIGKRGYGFSMQRLPMGGNVPLNAARFDVVVDWPARCGVLDASAYMLGADGRVRGDADMIFYNQRVDVSGCLRITEIDAGTTCFTFDLPMVPEDIERIVICTTVEDPGKTMAAFEGVNARVLTNGEASLGFYPELAGATVVAMQLVEVYRRNGTWKLRAVGQGFDAGLGALARYFGIDVAESDDSSGQTPDSPTVAQTPHPVTEPLVPVRQIVPPGSPPPPSPSPPAPPPPQAHRRLGVGNPRIELPALSLLNCKLSWSEDVGGSQWRARPLDLALGAFYRLRDGRDGLVQLCDFPGALDRAPWIQVLPSEAKSGHRDLSLRINLDQAHALSHCVLFAYIANGAANWRAREVEFFFAVSERVSVDLPSGGDGNAVLALTSIDFTAGNVAVTRMGDFFTTQRHLAEQVGWRLNWRSGGRD